MRVAAHPFCVWYNGGHMRTFRTAIGALGFQRRHGGVIGRDCEIEGWWIELDTAGLPPVEIERVPCPCGRHALAHAE